MGLIFFSLEALCVAQAGFELTFLFPGLLNARTTELHHHSSLTLCVLISKP